MPRLTFKRFTGRRDRGGVATIVALLMASGTLLGISGLVVDVGQLYGEREELQSAADSGAMAVALDCIYKRPECATANLTADGYADTNSKDGRSALSRSVCGLATSLPTCTGTEPDNLTACLGDRPTAGNYVEVRTRTEVASGDYVLPFSFAQTLSGIGQGQTVGACARVAWGSPTSGLALTFCSDEWDDATDDGNDLAPAPPAVPDARYEVVLKVHAPGSGHGAPTGACDVTPAGGDLPGDFGWLDSEGDCLSIIDGDGSYDVDPGSDVIRDCRTVLPRVVASHEPVVIPIYDTASGTGSHGEYHLKGMAAFVLTGYGNLPGLRDQPSWLPGSTASCGPGDQCIYGYFTEALVPWTGGVGPVPSLGATVVKTIG